MRSKKGQTVSLGSAPYVVMIVGFTFLLMATVAYVSYEYGSGFAVDSNSTVTEETLSPNVTEAGVYVASGKRGLCNFENFVVTSLNASNGSGEWHVLDSANYTSTSAGLIQATASAGIFNNTVWHASYTFDFTGGVACNITDALETEVDDNTSIAGVVLTIALVGIILSVLVGVFLSTRRSGL